MRKYSLALDSTISSQLQAEPVEEQALLEVRKRSKLERFVKRFFDVVISLAVLILGFPFFLAIGLLIKLTSRGPVFFKQQRVGENGELFFLYKFRSMKTGNDDSIHREFAQNYIQNPISKTTLDEKPEKLYKISNDPRVTAVGSFLRRSRGVCRRR